MAEYFSLNYAEEQMGETITGIVHIGAHYAEEAAEYESCGIPALWVEAHPIYATKMLENLAQYDTQYGIEALLSDVDDEEVDFWITADEFASSMLKPAYHQIQNPHALISDKIRLKTQRFETMWWRNDLELKIGDPTIYNLLVLDVQGAETKVWNGMGEFQNQFKAIISEYSTVEFYEGVPQLEDLDRIYEGFTRVFPDESLIHGDALYIRR